jgi:hypothetical protein
MKKMIKVIFAFFLFFPHLSIPVEMNILQEPLLPSEQLIAVQIPSLVYLWASISPDVLALPISIRERSLLRAPGPPPPPGGGTGGGGAVGEALAKDCAWIIILCCIVYGIYCRKRHTR